MGSVEMDPERRVRLGVGAGREGRTLGVLNVGSVLGG